MSIVVDLPAPFGPSSATISPARIEMSTPRTAWITPPRRVRYDLCNPLIWTPTDDAAAAGLLMRA